MCMHFRIVQAHVWRWPLPRREHEELLDRRLLDGLRDRVLEVPAQVADRLGLDRVHAARDRRARRDGTPARGGTRVISSSSSKFRRCQSMTESPRRRSRTASRSASVNSSSVLRRSRSAIGDDDTRSGARRQGGHASERLRRRRRRRRQRVRRGRRLERGRSARRRRRAPGGPRSWTRARCGSSGSGRASPRCAS